MRCSIAALFFFTVIPVSTQWCICSGVCRRYLICPFGCFRSGPYCSTAAQYLHDCETLQSNCDNQANCITANITPIAHNAVRIHCPTGTKEMRSDTTSLGSGDQVERTAKCFTSGTDRIWMVQYNGRWIPVKNIYCAKVKACKFANTNRHSVLRGSQNGKQWAVYKNKIRLSDDSSDSVIQKINF